MPSNGSATCVALFRRLRDVISLWVTWSASRRTCTVAWFVAISGVRRPSTINVDWWSTYAGQPACLNLSPPPLSLVLIDFSTHEFLFSNAGLFIPQRQWPRDPVWPDRINIKSKTRLYSAICHRPFRGAKCRYILVIYCGHISRWWWLFVVRLLHRECRCIP